MKNLCHCIIITIFFISCTPGKRTEHQATEGTASTQNGPDLLKPDTSTVQPDLPASDSSAIKNELFRIKIKNNLAEAENDTVGYWFIKETRTTICCKTFSRWFFDSTLQLKFVVSETEDEGANSNAYYFARGILAGGWEHWGAEDGQGHTFFTNEESIEGFSDEEDIFTDTTIYLTKGEVLEKIKNIERDKATLLESLKEISLDQWSEVNQVLNVHVTRPLSDHENEKVRYEISKPLFEKLIKPNAK